VRQHVAVFVSVVRAGVHPSCGVGSFVVVVQVVGLVFGPRMNWSVGERVSCNQSVLALRYGVLCQSAVRSWVNAAWMRIVPHS
jgi:hypothetical protein